LRLPQAKPQKHPQCTEDIKREKICCKMV